MTNSGVEFLLIGLAGVASGAVNALAGGGTLITFPVLVALGIPAIAANITCTVASSPGHLGATLAQAGDLKGQKRRMLFFLPAGIVGGVIGGILLLHTGQRQFRQIVPFLILLASALLAVQEPLRRWVLRRMDTRRPGSESRSRGQDVGIDGNQTARSSSSLKYAVLPVGLAAIYGGYFGAGLSVIVLAVLGLVVEDSLTRLNALKQSISFATNLAAAIFFMFSSHVHWPAAIAMAVASVIGGAIGGRIAGRVRPATLRWIVVVIGVTVALIYFVKR